MTDIEKDPPADCRGHGRSRETHWEATARVEVRNLGGLPGGGEHVQAWHTAGGRLGKETQMGSCWGTWAAGGCHGEGGG